MWKTASRQERQNELVGTRVLFSQPRLRARCGRPFRQKTAFLAMLLLGTMTLLIFIIASIFASLHPSIALLIH
jgi:hypothetical protein